jgi:hypothetical protein
VAAALPVLGGVAPAGKGTGEAAPVSVSKAEGTAGMRVVLLPEAAQRLDINTVGVREEAVSPLRKFPGEVISIRSDTKFAILQVELTEEDMKTVRRDEPVLLVVLGRNGKAQGVRALPVKEPTAMGLYEHRSLYYETSDADHSLVNRQLVLVEIPLVGGTQTRKCIPYAALLYDATGNTWVYTNPEPFVFIRRPVSIDAIVGDEVRLRDGPPAGTDVVTVGVAELYGAEVGVGK